MHDIIEDGLAADILQAVSISFLQVVFYLLARIAWAGLKLAQDEGFILIQLVKIVTLIRITLQEF